MSDREGAFSSFFGVAEDIFATKAKPKKKEASIFDNFVDNDDNDDFLTKTAEEPAPGDEGDTPAVANTEEETVESLEEKVDVDLGG